MDCLFIGLYLEYRTIANTKYHLKIKRTSYLLKLQLKSIHKTKIHCIIGICTLTTIDLMFHVISFLFFFYFLVYSFGFIGNSWQRFRLDCIIFELHLQGHIFTNRESCYTYGITSNSKYSRN